MHRAAADAGEATEPVAADASPSREAPRTGEQAAEPLVPPLYSLLKISHVVQSRVRGEKGRRAAPEAGPTPALYRCVLTEMHGLNFRFWAN